MQQIPSVQTAVPAGMWTVWTCQTALVIYPVFFFFFTSSSLNSTEPSYRTTPFMEHQVHLRSNFFFIIIIIWSLFLLCFSWICICKPNFKHFLHLCLDVDVQYNVAFLYRPWSSSSLELDEAKSIRKHCF